MKVKSAFIGVIFIGLCITACSSTVYEIKQEKNSGGTININIQTNANGSNVNITIDKVKVDMEALKKCLQKKSNEDKKREKRPHKIYGTF